MTKSNVVNKILKDSGFKTKQYSNAVVASLINRKPSNMEIREVLSNNLEGIKFNIQTTSDSVIVYV